MTAARPVVAVDPFTARRALGAVGILHAFNAAGVLAAADVHVALRLGRLGGESDEAVLLAVALAVRAPRLGHVHVDLATIRDTATVDVEEPGDLAALPWPDPEGWLARVAASPLVATGEEGEAGRPLRLLGARLHLDRFWREEVQVARDLVALATSAPPAVDPALLAAGLDRLFTGGAKDERQRIAAASAVLRRLAVVAGGPGTGKTTTVARIVALLFEQAAAAGAPPPLVALAAPTGKAAARLEEAVHEQAAKLDVDPAVREGLLATRAQTLHRLLGWRPDSHSRFRHDRGNRLPHDVVVVDETSMVGLSMMARLVEAVRPEARLVLVGDPGQLTSIEAGAVLGDVVGPAADGLRLGASARERLTEVTGLLVDAADPPPGALVADGIVVLERGHRFYGAIARLAAAVRRGDGDAVLEVLDEAPQPASASGGRVTWLPFDPADPASRSALEPVRAGAVDCARAVTAAARAGDGRRALAELGAFRLLCAHRRGSHGVAAWTVEVEAWLSAAIDGFGAGGRWYVGRPLLIGENDGETGLFNGDTGVVLAPDGGRRSRTVAPDVAAIARPRAAFERRGAVLALAPARLPAAETVYAMTIHKAQGSQFDTAAVLLPPPSSRILTRELLYTAITRAQTHLILAGTEETIRAAVARPVTRASGLRERLWGL